MGSREAIGPAAEALLEPGEQVLATARARDSNLRIGLGIGGATFRGRSLPEDLAIAVTSARLLLWSASKLTGKPKELLAAPRLGSEVGRVGVGPNVLRFDVERDRVQVAVGNVADLRAVQSCLAGAIGPFLRGGGDPAAVALRWALLGQTWEHAAAVLGSLADPHRREQVVLSLLAAPVHDVGRAALERWTLERPDDPNGWLALGANTIGQAWEVRGSAPAASVDPRAWPEFERLLREAEHRLRRAVELAPDDAVPWTPLLRSGRGLSVGPAELQARFAESHRRVPDLFGAHAGLLQGLCEKWGGSHELMFGFARETSAHAPVGSPLHALVVEAHVERDLALEPRRSDYFWQTDVINEIVAAAERSVFAPVWVDDSTTVEALNDFACAVYLCGNKPVAKELVARIGVRMARFPWTHFSRTGADLFDRARLGA